MLRSARHALVAALIALHAAVIAGGAGLHALPGWSHGTGLRSLARNDHSHGPGKTSRQAADDCPVCQFLAQGQLACAPAADVSAWLVVGVATLSAPDADPASPRTPSAPRGPPRAS